MPGARVDLGLFLYVEKKIDRESKYHVADFPPKIPMSAITHDQIDQITSMVRKQLGSDPGGIMRDERVWTLVIHLQNYAVTTLSDLEGMATTERKWKRGCEDICRWDDAVLEEEVGRLKEADPSIEKRYHFAVVRYVKHLYRNVRSHRMKLSVVPLKEFLRTFLQVLMTRADVKNRNLLDFGPSDQQHAILDVFRITMDRLYNKVSDGSGNDDYVYVGAESVVGGGSIAPSESVSCMAVRQTSAQPAGLPPRPNVPSFLSKERLEQHKSQAPAGSQVSRRSAKSKPAAPPSAVAPPEGVVREDKSMVRSTASFRRAHNQPGKPPEEHNNIVETNVAANQPGVARTEVHTRASTRVSRGSRTGARTEISAAPSRMTSKRSAVSRRSSAPEGGGSVVAPERSVASVREVDLGGGGTQVSHQSRASKFRRPPRSSRHSSSRTTISTRSAAPPRASSASTVSSSKNKKGCFFDLSSKISDDVRSHAP